MSIPDNNDTNDLKNTLVIYKQLSVLYPEKYQHLQRQIEVHLKLNQYDEAELLLEQLHTLLLQQGLTDDAREAEKIRKHLTQKKHSDKYYTAPFLHLATGNLIERVFQQNKQIHIAEGEYLVRYGEQGNQMFILLHGELAVWSRDKLGRKHFEHTLRYGEIVGEIAYLDGSTRNADVIACQPSTLLLIPHKEVVRLFIEDPRIEQSLREEANTRRIQVEMKNNSSLKHLPNHLQRIMAEEGMFIYHKALERIYQSEQPIEYIDLICDGYLRLVSEHSDGSSLILNSLKNDSLIGCSAIIPEMENTYSADIVCISDVTLVRFPVSLFIKIAEINPRLYQALLKQAELERDSLLHTIRTETFS